MDALNDFLSESLRIEGIMRPPLLPEIEATEKFLQLPKLTVDDVVKLAQVYQPDALLRTKMNMNVRVGNHYPPKGGPAVVAKLVAILDNAVNKNPWKTHVEYMGLQPLSSGNGRTGRTIWLWQRIRQGGEVPRSFLHEMYPEALSVGRN